MYGGVNTLSHSHGVTATEAAYGTLFGCFLPRRGWSWFQSADWPEIHQYEEWLVDNFTVAIRSAAGEEYNGRVIEIFKPLPRGNGVEIVPSTFVYTYGNRVHLLRPVQTQYGMGCLFRTPSLIDTDIIDINLTYRARLDRSLRG